jgi:Uma2 family endonuclease
MTAILPLSKKALPDHTQLPDSDGAVVQNFQEHPQSILLTDAITPVLDRLRPDGRYCIGQDCGIYWDFADPPLRGCVAPDWFYVPGVSPTIAGQRRRSFVMWQELVAPVVLLEFVSGDGTEERDSTPDEGKFWIYEQRVRPAYYGIYEVDPGQIEMYQLTGAHFERMSPNERGHFPIVELGVELGLWQGTYLGATFPWMRWYDSKGILLATGHELAQQEFEAAQRERTAARQEIERLAALVLKLGGDPNAS